MYTFQLFLKILEAFFYSGKLSNLILCNNAVILMDFAIKISLILGQIFPDFGVVTQKTSLWENSTNGDLLGDVPDYVHG